MGLLRLVSDGVSECQRRCQGIHRQQVPISPRTARTPGGACKNVRLSGEGLPLAWLVFVQERVANVGAMIKLGIHRDPASPPSTKINIRLAITARKILPSLRRIWPSCFFFAIYPSPNHAHTEGLTDEIGVEGSSKGGSLECRIFSGRRGAPGRCRNERDSILPCCVNRSK
jgi:hypothetical protein